MSSVTFQTPDGVTLSGALHEAAGAPKAVVVIASALGVRHKLYRYLAEHLAARGLTTLRFDYRGIDESLHGDIRSMRHVTVQDWGEHDLAAAIRFARERSPKVPVLHLGHSIGGQIFGLCPEAPSVTASLMIAAQSGYWKNWPGAGRALMRLNWLAIPPVARWFGYLPMKRLGQGENVPLGVALEWARWGRHPDYILSNPLARGPNGLGSLKLPIRAYVVSDDVYAPRPTVEALLRMYCLARTELREVTPGGLGVKSIGHFGLFRREFEPTFWNEAAQWLLQAAQGAQ